MNLSIRQHVTNNFKKLNFDEIRSSIEGGVGNSDEVVLPGLGVLFEVIYKNSDETQKRNLVNQIKEHL